MASIVKQDILQKVLGFVPGQGLMRLMVQQLLLDSLEQGLVDDCRLLAGQYLTFVFDLADKNRLRRRWARGVRRLSFRWAW
jgi:hypothetical protein